MSNIVLTDQRIVVRGVPRSKLYGLKGIEYEIKGGTVTVYQDWPTLELIVDRLGVSMSKGAESWLATCRAMPRFRQVSKLDGMHDYQARGAAWLYNLKRAILADEPGLGKTVQAIAATEQCIREANRPPRILVLCKNTFCYNWSVEIKHWSGRGSTIITAANRRQQLSTWLQQSCGYLIVGWSTLRVFPELADVKWDVVIADESHKIKNKSTKTFGKFKSLKTEYMFLLTATPFSLHAAEVWTSLHAIDRKLFPSYWRFYNLFVKTIMLGEFPKIIGNQNVDIYGRVVGRYMLKRLASDCFDELPPKVTQTIEVPMQKKQAMAYRDMRDRMVAELEGLPLIAPTSLVRTTRLRQLASTTKTIWPTTDHSGKLDAVVELVEDMPGQVVIATDFRDTCVALKERLQKDAVVLMGGEDYSEALDAFRSGKCKCLVMTRGTGGESHNFDNADTMIVLERPWNPADEQQLEDRIYRPATERKALKRVIYLQHPKSIDTIVARRVWHRVKLTNRSLLEILKAQEGFLL